MKCLDIETFPRYLSFHLKHSTSVEKLEQQWEVSHHHSHYFTPIILITYYTGMQCHCRIESNVQQMKICGCWYYNLYSMKV